MNRKKRQGNMEMYKFKFKTGNSLKVLLSQWDFK